MKDHKDPDNSWIILDENTILTKVHGVLFATEGFKDDPKASIKEGKDDHKIASCTGVVPFSKLKLLFEGDVDVIIKFLCHLEYCYEITDTKLHTLIVHTDDNMSLPAQEQGYFFFPGLVGEEIPQYHWSPDATYGCHYGWITECSNPEDFLSPRFIDTLVLRLVFHFASTLSAVHHPALHTQLNVWKNANTRGISWNNTNGGKAVVEIINKRQVVVLTCCKWEQGLESGRLLSDIIHKVLETVKDICSDIALTESVIQSEECKLYPIDFASVTTISIRDVARDNIKKHAKFVTLKTHVDIENFLKFEPYVNLGEETVKEIFDEDNVEHHQKVSDKFVHHVAEQMSSKADKYNAIFKEDLNECPGDVDILIKTIQSWKMKMESGGTRCSLHKELDQFSVFAGRNPLKVATGMPWIFVRLHEAAR